MKQIQQIESREDLGALIEGDLVDTQQGIMVYTEEYEQVQYDCNQSIIKNSRMEEIEIEA